MSLAIKHWLLAVFSSVRKVTSIFFTILSLLLIVSCAGGGGGGGGGGPAGGGLNAEQIDGLLTVRPHETYAYLDWSLPQGEEIQQIRIEILQNGRVIRVIRINDVTTVSWRVDDLTEGAEYEFRVNFVYSDRIDYLSSGDEEVTTGSNIDNDTLIDDDDNDNAGSGGDPNTGGGGDPNTGGGGGTTGGDVVVNEMDTDGDNIPDNKDSCLLVANDGINVDDDNIDDVCDANLTASQDLWFTPEDRGLVISWLNPPGSEIGVFNVSLRDTNGTVIGIPDLDESTLAAGSLAAGSYSHYRYSGLKNDVSYHVEVVLLNRTDGSVVASLGIGADDLYSVVVGLNTDGDHLINAFDPDDDNDGLLDTEEVDEAGDPLVVNGTVCSLSTDCDGDEVADDVDAFPLDATETADTDGDGTGDNADSFPNNPTEMADMDNDGFGDGIDNCPNDSNPSQANQDGDALGDECDTDPTNADLASASARQVTVSSSTEIGDQPDSLSSTVDLIWTNPTSLYLPKATTQPQSLPVSAFGLEIHSGSQEVDLAGLDISYVAGADLAAASQLDVTAGTMTGYRIAGLANGTEYTFTISATYTYEALTSNSSEPGATSQVQETIILATIKESTPAVAGPPAITFDANSGADEVSLSWVLPQIPPDYTLTAIEVVGCKLDDADAECAATLQGTVLKTIPKTDLGTVFATTLDDTEINRAYLYNITLNATYREAGVTADEEVFGNTAIVAIYPAVIPAPMNLANTDRQDGFSLSWDNIDPTTATGYDKFEQIGEGIAYYNLTVYTAEATGSYRRSLIERNWQSFRQQIDSDDLITDPNQRTAGRFYHVELSTSYTTGQQSQIDASIGTYVRASMWPQPKPVSGVAGEVQGSGFLVSWDNPDNEALFTAIEQSIDQFLIQACKSGVTPPDCSNQVMANGDAANGFIGRSDGLEYDTDYVFNVTVVYSTNQRSSSAPSTTVTQLPLTAQQEAESPAASDDSAEYLRVSWTNPPIEIPGRTIKEFRITPCSYDSSVATDCSTLSEIVLTGASLGVSTAYGAMNSYDVSRESVIERAKLYEFEIDIIYDDDNSAEDIRSNGATTTKGVLLPNSIPGVPDVTADNGFGPFELRWVKPTDAGIEEFTRIGENIENYRIVISDLGNMTADFAAYLDSDSGRYTIGSDQLAKDGGGSFNFMKDEVYQVSIITIYSSGQQSTASAEVGVSVGPELASPYSVDAMTGEDSLNISWRHDAYLEDDLFTLGYGFRFLVGVDCGDPAELINCKRNVTTPLASPTTIVFEPTVTAGQQGSELARGQWYQVVVSAHWTAPNGNIQSRKSVAAGGIYPEVTGVEDITVTSIAGASGPSEADRSRITVAWNWDDPMVSDIFRQRTGYSRSVSAVASGNDRSNNLVTVDFPSQDWTAGTTDGVISSNPNQADDAHGVVFPVMITTTYSGNSGYAYEKVIAGAAQKGVLYPYPAISENVMGLTATSGETSIGVGWTAPVLSDFSNIVNEFGYGIRGWTVTACETAAPEVCFDTNVPAGTTSAVLTESVEGLKKGKLYSISVQTNYEGQDTESSASNTPKASSEYIDITGDYYIYPTITSMNGVNTVTASQPEGESALQISFMPPQDFATYTSLGFSTVTYEITLYDSNDMAVANAVLPNQPLGPSGLPVTTKIGYSGVDYDLTYYVRVRTIYPNNQFFDIDSDRSTDITLVTVEYLPVEAATATSGPDSITLTWNAPSSLPANTAIDQFTIEIQCDDIDDTGDDTLNHNCNGITGYEGHTDIVAYISGTDLYSFTYDRSIGDLKAGVLYAANVTIQYRDTVDASQRHVALAPNDQPKVALFPAIKPPRAKVSSHIPGAMVVDFEPAQVMGEVLGQPDITTPKQLFIDHFNYRINDSGTAYSVEVRHPDSSAAPILTTNLRHDDARQATIRLSSDPLGVNPLRLYNISVTANFMVDSRITAFSGNSIRVEGNGVIAGGYPAAEQPVDSVDAASYIDNITVTVNVAHLVQSGPFVTNDHLTQFKNIYRYSLSNYTIELCAGKSSSSCVDDQLFRETDRGSTDQFEVVFDDSTIAKGRKYTVNVTANYEHGLVSDTYPSKVSSDPVSAPERHFIHPDITHPDYRIVRVIPSINTPGRIELRWDISKLEPAVDYYNRLLGYDPVFGSDPSSLTGYRIEGCLIEQPSNCFVVMASWNAPVHTVNLRSSFEISSATIFKSGHRTFLLNPNGVYSIRIAPIFVGDASGRYPTDRLNPFSAEAKGRIPRDDRDGVIAGDDIDDDGDGLIEISDGAELLLMREDLAGSSLDGTTDGCPDTGCIGYELTDDIDMLSLAQSGHSIWSPIGTRDNPFVGTFDGNNYRITNLRINEDLVAVGFFGVLSGATVKNVHIDFSQIASSRNVSEGLPDEQQPSLGVIAGDMRDGSRLLYVSAAGPKVEMILNPRFDYGPQVFPGGTYTRPFVGGLVGRVGSSLSGDASAGNQIIGSFARIGRIITRYMGGGLIGIGYTETDGSQGELNLVTGSYAHIGELYGDDLKAPRTTLDHYLGGIAAQLELEPTGTAHPDGANTFTYDLSNSYAIVDRIHAEGDTNGDITGPVLGLGSRFRAAGMKIDEVYGAVDQVWGRMRLPGSGFYSDDLHASLENTEGRRSMTELRGYTKDSTDVGDWTREAGATDLLGIWCDRNNNGMIDAIEKTDSNLLWDFGTDRQYPAIRCSAFTTYEQRQ